MDWIKKNPEKFSLLALSLALLAAAVFLFMNALTFFKSFDILRAPVVESKTLPPLDTGPLKAAQDSVDKPETWIYDTEHEGSLFKSEPYVWQPKEGQQYGTITTLSSGTFYPPVPNDWILKYHFDLLDPNVISEDPDHDGFTNKEEYLAGTDPTDKNSHPPYITKLFLEAWIQKHFRLIFNGQPDNTSFQIDTVDVPQPTQILSMGDLIAGTKYKIVGFVHKTKTDDNGVEHDISELTIENTETGKKVVLVVGQVVDDPDSYALFKYFWKKPPVEIKVKKDDTFTLDPESDVSYKVIDIQKDHATIVNLKTNKEILIPLYKQGGDTFHSPEGKFYSPTDGKPIM